MTCTELKGYANYYIIWFSFLIAGLFIFQISPCISWASSTTEIHNAPISEDNSNSSALPWYQKFDTQWGGHLKLSETVSWIDDDSPYTIIDTGPYYDGSVDARLKNKTYLTDQSFITAHYEIVYSGGDTRENQNKLKQLFPGFFNDPLMSPDTMDDDSRFLDLTKTIQETDRHVLYHRMDRLSLTMQPNWGTICIGRQAITWGNGLVFNPMDLFNPFAPTDVERDYKVGDDMITAQLPLHDIGNIQTLYIPRRDPADHHTTSSRSSFAGKLHFSASTYEFDMMAARHYNDNIFGLGTIGYILNAAWRLDVLGTVIEDESEQDDYLSMIMNIDYSWIWWKKNFYGFLEIFYNGLGDTDYSDAISNTSITERMSRGDIFFFGRKYLAAGIKIELHPLLQAYMTVINNLSDPSGIIQPRLVWDITQDLQCIMGGNIYYGGSDTEFGGFSIENSTYNYVPSNNVYIRITYFF